MNDISVSEVQMKTLVQSGIFCMSVLQTSRRHRVSVQGFCVFSGCGAGWGFCSFLLCQAQHHSAVCSLQGDIGFRGPPGIPGPPGKSVCIPVSLPPTACSIPPSWALLPVNRICADHLHHIIPFALSLHLEQCYFT